MALTEARATVTGQWQISGSAATECLLGASRLKPEGTSMRELTLSILRVTTVNITRNLWLLPTNNSSHQNHDGLGYIQTLPLKSGRPCFKEQTHLKG